MASNTSSPPALSGAGEVMTPGDLAQAMADLAAAERHLARAVVTLGRLAGSGVCERVEGLPLDLFLGVAGRLPGADRGMIIGAGQTLRQLPATAALFEQGAVSWGQVRRIVAAARRLGAAERAVLDARVAASAATYDGVDAYGPDDLCDAVDAAADELRSARSVERAERAARASNYLQVQRGLLDRVQFYGDYDAVTAAPIINALDAAAGPPAGCGGDDAAAAAGAGRSDAPPVNLAPDASAPTRRGAQYAAALQRLALAYLGGGSGRPAAPSLVAHVDLSQVHVNHAGVLELNVRGPLPRVSLAALEALARDAGVRAVLLDGSRPLAVTAKVHARDIPADVRVAAAARDLGCRFPASRDPLGHCDLHHTTPRAAGGMHHIDALVHLSRRRHTLTHRHGWTLSLEPATGMITVRRGERAWRSLPRGTPLAGPPDTRPPPIPRPRTSPRSQPSPSPAGNQTLPF